MRLQVRVTPRATRRSVEIAADDVVIVKVSEPAEDGRANTAVIEALADYFSVPKRRVMIVRGMSSRRKVVEISP